MSKFRSIILIIGLLIITVAAALLTVLILYATGTIKTDPIELVYSVDSASKLYDGTPLTLDENAYVLESGEILEGHTAQVKIIGAQTNAGESKATLEVKIFDKKGFDVSDEYAVKVNVGTLTVEKQNLSVIIEDSSVPYSGKRVYFDNYKILEGELAKGHKIAGVNVSLLNVGDPVPDDISPVIYDAFDNDVSENYEFLDFDVVGRVEITPRPLTVRPKNITKVYDGIEFEATEYEIIGGSLAEGQTVKYTVKTLDGGDAIFSNCTDEYGERIELVDFKIFDGDKEIDLKNYQPAINNHLLETGIVKITQRPITVSTATAVFTYNGEAQFNDNIQFFSGSLAPNQTYSVTEPTTVTDVIEGMDNELTLKINYNGRDVSDNYDITYITGKLSVKPFDLTVYTKSYTKEYDGNNLEGIMAAPYFELSTNISDKFTVTADCAAAVKNQVNAITETSYVVENVVIKLNGDNTDCTSNFNINLREGKYSITPKHEDISLNKNLTKEYTGNTVQITKNEAFEDLPEGLTADDFEIAYLSEIKNAGTHYYTATYKGASGNYDISVDNGKVVINKKQVTVTYNGTRVSMTYNGMDNYYSDDSELIKALSVDIGKVQSAVFTKALESVAVDSVTVYADGEDITSNLTITCNVTIPVTVNKCKITLVLPEYTDDYYRSELIAAGVSAMGLAAGDELVVSASDITNDGTSTYYVTDCSVVHNGEDISRFYTVDFGEGGKYFVPD